ncbi:MAG: ATP-dependent helicase C-terminal domain-containing protein [Acetobacteraceae bacterium]
MARHKFLVVPRLQHTRAARIAIASTMKVTRETALDPTTGRVISREKRRLGRLLLSEKDVDVPEADLTALLLDDVRSHLRSDLPQMDDAHLTESLEDWLSPWITDSRSRTHLAALNLISILKSRLNWEQQNWLDANLPQCLHLPRGMVEIDYTAPNPTISARAPLFYGCAETPRIAAGAIKLQFALLSPAGRAQAITADLASFWKTGWADMWRDMRGRYPKHEWPEDPSDAALKQVKPGHNGP